MVPCTIHNLINRDPTGKLTKDEFKKFWEMFQADKQFTMELGGAQLQAYKGFKQMPGDIETCLENNGFGLMAKTTKQ